MPNIEGDAAHLLGRPQFVAMETSWTQLLFVSAVVMGMSHTISKERIFEPLRRWLGGKETFFGYLVSCPYCASHYLAFALVPLTSSYFIDVTMEWGIVARLMEWFLSSILITVLAAFLRVAFWFVDETQSLVRKRKQRVDKDVQGKGRALPHALRLPPEKPVQ